MHCFEQFKAKVVSIMHILQIMFANVTPIVGPPKKWKIAIHAIQTVFLDPINIGSIVG